MWTVEVEIKRFNGRVTTSPAIARSRQARRRALADREHSVHSGQILSVWAGRRIYLISLMWLDDMLSHGWQVSALTEEGDITMRLTSPRFLTAALLPPVVVAGLFLGAGSAAANVPLTPISADPFTDAQAQHRTEVEPDTFAFGSTSVSADGGLTWGPAQAPTDNATGLGGQPLVQFNGTVVVPYRSLNGQIRSFSSADGGTSWAASVLVSAVSHHPVAGGLRSGSFLP